jgi:hypothetical protein
MELIQFNKNGGPVTIDITINGASLWSYEYVGDSTFKNNSGTSNGSTHILGSPVNLENDINSWDIRFGNISDDSFVAAATVDWKQDGQVLKTWTERVLVPAESVANISADALLIGNTVTVVI